MIDSGSEVNAIYPAFTKQPSLLIRPTDVGAQKIDGTTLDTYGMVVAAFSVEDKTNWVRFFEKTFLVANVSPEVVLEIPFLTLSGADIDVLGWELRWRTYTTKKGLPTTKRIELVGKKKFVVAAHDPEYETHTDHVASLSSAPLVASLSSALLVASLNVHPSRRPQISGLIADEALIKVPAKYSDFADVFSPDLAIELSEHTEINTHIIDLEEGKQSP